MLVGRCGCRRKWVKKSVQRLYDEARLPRSVTRGKSMFHTQPQSATLAGPPLQRSNRLHGNKEHLPRIHFIRQNLANRSFSSTHPYCRNFMERNWVDQFKNWENRTGCTEESFFMNHSVWLLAYTSEILA
jgi:hypothetical protein